VVKLVDTMDLKSIA